MKYIKLVILLQILIISLKKIDILNKKKYIKINNVLGVYGKYILLYGVVCNKGKFNFGHYTASLNIGLKEQWYEFNDFSISIIINELQIDNSYSKCFILTHPPWEGFWKYFKKGVRHVSNISFFDYVW